MDSKPLFEGVEVGLRITQGMSLVQEVVAAIGGTGEPSPRPDYWYSQYSGHCRSPEFRMASVFDFGGGDCCGRTQINPFKCLVIRRLVVEAAGVELEVSGSLNLLTVRELWSQLIEWAPLPHRTNSWRVPARSLAPTEFVER